MSISLEELDQSIRSPGTIAIGHRSPRDPASEGIGVTVACFIE